MAPVAKDPNRFRNRFAALASAIPCGAMFLDAHWRVVWCNDQLNEWHHTGDVHDTNSLVQASMRVLFASDAEFEAWRTNVRYAIEERRADARELRVVVADATPRWALATTHRYEGEPGVAMIVTLLDITEQRDLRERTRRDLSMQSFILRNITDLVIRLDARGTITALNAPAAKWLRVGESLADAADDGAAVEALLASATQAPPLGTECSLKLHRPAEAPRAFEGTLRPLRGDDGTLAGLSLVLRDAHREAELDQFLQRAGLTERETEIFLLVLDGYTNLNVAAITGISENGVKFHLKNIFRKAAVGSRAELLSRFIAGGVSSTPGAPGRPR